mmetsp:Transcript_45677/g.83727  ORF Transcript_45677/g.83727 Transcript_45677/m.83727 type:complete len:258 (+) Transcript_45677:805-1578(+)
MLVIACGATVVVSTDVMRPPAKQNIGCQWSHLDFKLQRAEFLECISRETKTIALSTKTSIASQDDGALALRTRMLCKDVVRPEERCWLLWIPSTYVRSATWIVEPPPITSSFHRWCISNCPEKGINIRRVVHVALHCLVGADLGVRKTHSTGHCEVLLLTVINTVLHVHTEDHLEAILMHVLEKTMRIWEKRSVESETIPPITAMARLGSPRNVWVWPAPVLVRTKVCDGIVDVMPWHVQYSHVQWQSVCPILVHYF